MPQSKTGKVFTPFVSSSAFSKQGYGLECYSNSVTGIVQMNLPLE
jgi:hypothetical protein